jgi:chemotaxis protein CheD
MDRHANADFRQPTEIVPEDRGRSKVYLHPGQLFASAECAAVTTILGSCVAVCLFDPITKVGGVNHFLLPLWVGEGAVSPKFGNVAIEKLIARLLALGSQSQRLQAKLFGGACVMEAFRSRESHLGTKNVEVAQALLKQKGIHLVGHDIGGSRGRKLIFHTDTGTAWVKEL